MSLVARRLEEAGITTVVVGSARDIVEQCAVPRFLFTDFPLGNPCGRPDDIGMQRSIVGLALELANTAIAAQSTVRAPFEFDDDGSWRNSYMEITPERREELRAAGEARRRKQAATRAMTNAS